MKITILNDSFFNESHLDQLGELAVFDGTANTKDAIIRTANSDVVLADIFLSDFNKEYFESVPNLKLLAINSTSFALVDLKTAETKGIKVANCPGFSKRSVAELAVGLMFSAVRGISYGDKKYREGFTDQDQASKEGREFISYNLEGKTLGVVGVGRIGSEIANIAQGIGMNVVGWNRTKRDGIKLVELDELMNTSDVVVVTLAYSDETENTLSKELLFKLKENAVVVNIGKRNLIDMGTLTELLMKNKIRGAGFDWAQCEKNDPLLTLNNVVFTPHIASYTAESFYKNLPDMIVANVRNFAEGNPQNIVNT